MKKLVTVLTLVILVAPLAVKAQALENFISKADSFFATHVKQGKVDYKTIHANPASLAELMESANTIQVPETSTNEFQAFWINAYNLAVIQGIVANYPIKSPLDKAGFFDKTTYNIAGKSITLNDIENKMLRAKFNDPRVHFVLVCGAHGCPPIIGAAYTPGNLQEQLDVQTTKAINNPNFIRVSGKKVEVSQIFEWYNQDFETDSSTLIDFINRYKKEPIMANAKVRYYAYDWNLNSL